MNKEADVLLSLYFPETLKLLKNQNLFGEKLFRPLILTNCFTLSASTLKILSL